MHVTHQRKNSYRTSSTSDFVREAVDRFPGRIGIEVDEKITYPSHAFIYFFSQIQVDGVLIPQDFLFNVAPLVKGEV